MNRTVAWVLVALTLVGAGCVRSATPIQVVYQDQLKDVQVGMSTAEFLAVMPEAYVGGQGDEWTAYIVADEQYRPYAQGSHYWSGRVHQRLHFYFKNDQLVRWGKPGDWEADFTADVTVRQE